jgi:NADPH:quinone reductase-like Zn-dependent oxidoreductase
MKIRKIRIHRFGGPDVLQIDDVEPSLPDASQVLVSVKAASVNPVDFKIRNGQYPAVKEDRLPYAAKGARVLTTVSTHNVEFARALGADVVIDYKTQRFEEQAEDLDMVLDLIDGETRERSWKLLKRGGVLVSTLTEPSQEVALRHGVRALRYTVEANGRELAEIVDLVRLGKVRPHVQKTFRLEEASLAMAAVEKGGAVGKIVLSLE